MPRSTVLFVFLSLPVALIAGSPGGAAAQSGSFRSDAHPTSGGVRIVEEDGARHVELASTFRTDAGPDLFVLLHRQATPSSYARAQFVNLGRLRRVRGTQRYRIPDGVDPTRYRSVVIWCKEFDVTFGHAVLR